MKKRKKVVHLSTVHHPFDTRIFHKECVALAEAGYDVVLLVTGEDAQKPPVEVVKGVTVKRIKKRNNRINRMLFGAWELYLKAKKEQATFIHFHDPELMWIAKLLKNTHNIVIYDVHEDYLTSIDQKDYLPRFMKKIFKRLYQLVERFLTKGMAICLAEKYYQENYPAGKLILNYPILNEALTSRKIIHPHSPTFIYTGNVTKVRGAFEHVDLVNHVQGASVNFFGKVDHELTEEMVNKAVDSDALSFVGINQYVKREAIDQAYLSEAYLGGLAVFPRTDHYLRKELTKFFEYMMAGIPIICSNFPVWEAFINEHQCGIVLDPNQPQSWQEEINQLVSNQVLYQTLAENGRQAVLSELNWDIEKGKLLNWYQRLEEEIR